jgi:hypothetical protein
MLHPPQELLLLLNAAAAADDGISGWNTQAQKLRLPSMHMRSCTVLL